MPAGIDVGGTFTDAAWVDADGLHAAKVPSTPHPDEGVRRALALIGERLAVLFHGSTVATNAVLEGDLGVTALITDHGFEDIIEIGRQNRPALYDMSITRPEPLVPRRLRFGAGGRADLPDEVEAAAICLIGSHSDDRAERTAGTQVTGIPVSLGSQVSPEIREFERVATAVLNAALIPVVAPYLERIAEALADGELGILRSSGGLMPASTAATLPAAMLLSGPAGGAAAAAALAAHRGWQRVIAFDMGGTSTDVSRIEGGSPEMRFETSVGGHVCRLPSLAIHTIGAGGGSIAWHDAGGALRVGPRSAGATPGPVAYGHGGTEPTVTDANVAVGVLASELAGGIELHPRAATEALRRLGDELGIDARTAALGVLAVVETAMGQAVRAVSVEQGVDPRGSTLVAFGGAGGAHATRLARSLDLAAVAIPPHAGVFSALGMLLSPPRVDLAASVAGLTWDQARSRLAELGRSAGDAVAGGGRVEHGIDLRYMGQSHELHVPAQPDEPWRSLVDRFHAAHEQRSGFARHNDPVEPVTARAVATGTPAITWDELPPPTPSGEARRGEREVLTSEGSVSTSLWERSGLIPSTEVVGPAIVADSHSTTFIGPGERALVCEDGTLEVEW